MEDPEVTKKKVADFLQTLTSPGRLNLKFNILAYNGQVQPNASDSAGAAAPATQSTPEISVELSGADVPLVLARNGELLLAIEHIAAKILRFEHEEHDRISFDAENFKVLRHQELVLAAEAAIDRVRRTGQPFSFSPACCTWRSPLPAWRLHPQAMGRAASSFSIRKAKSHLRGQARTIAPLLSASASVAASHPDQAARCRRRIAPAAPTSPVARSTRLAGSGASAVTVGGGGGGLSDVVPIVGGFVGIFPCGAPPPGNPPYPGGRKNPGAPGAPPPNG